MRSLVLALIFCSAIISESSPFKRIAETIQNYPKTTTALLATSTSSLLVHVLHVKFSANYNRNSNTELINGQLNVTINHVFPQLDPFLEALSNNKESNR